MALGRCTVSGLACGGERQRRDGRIVVVRKDLFEQCESLGVFSSGLRRFRAVQDQERRRWGQPRGRSR